MKDKIKKFGILFAFIVMFFYFHKLLLFAIPLFIFYTMTQYKKFKKLESKVESYQPPSQSYWSEKTLMVLINPNSGTRESVKYFKQVVQPMMLKAHINLEPIILKNTHHIR